MGFFTIAISTKNDFFANDFGKNGIKKFGFERKNLKLATETKNYKNKRTCKKVA